MSPNRARRTEFFGTKRETRCKSLAFDARHNAARVNGDRTDRCNNLHREGQKKKKKGSFENRKSLNSFRPFFFFFFFSVAVRNALLPESEVHSCYSTIYVHEPAPTHLSGVGTRTIGLLCAIRVESSSISTERVEGGKKGKKRRSFRFYVGYPISCNVDTKIDECVLGHDVRCINYAVNGKLLYSSVSFDSWFCVRPGPNDTSKYFRSFFVFFFFSFAIVTQAFSNSDHGT